MKPVACVLAFCVAALAVSAAPAAEGLELAKKYVAFWEPVAGTWEVTTEQEGQEKTDEAGTFLWECKKSPTGLYYTSSGQANGQVVSHGIHGYDPSHKCWHFVSYGLPPDDDSPLHRTTWLMIDLSKGKRARTGFTFLSEGRQVMPDGKVREGRARWTLQTVERNKIEIQFTEGTLDGEAQPDIRMVFKRVKPKTKGEKK